MDKASPNGWKTRAEFVPYCDAISDIPCLGSIDNGGKDFFTHLPKLFLDTFVDSYAKLVELCWHHRKILMYLLFGSPDQGRILLNWLVVATDGQDMTLYSFPVRTIELKNHVSNNDTIRISN